MATPSADLALSNAAHEETINRLEEENQRLRWALATLLPTLLHCNVRLPGPFARWISSLTPAFIARDEVRATQGRTTGGYGSERLGDLTAGIELMAGNLEEDEKARVQQLDRLQESVRSALIEHSDAEAQAARMAIQAHELEAQARSATANPNPNPSSSIVPPHSLWRALC